MKKSINEKEQCAQTDVKCRFFAQYWGTKTMYVGGVGLVEVGKGGWNLKHPDFFLQLKPLSKNAQVPQCDKTAVMPCFYYFDVNRRVYEKDGIKRNAPFY